MLRAVAFVPSAPLLLPALGGGPADLRAAVEEAVAGLSGRVVAIGAAPVTGPARGVVDATGFGVRGAPAPDALPLALAVAASLIGGAVLFGVGPGGDPLAVGAGLHADSLLVVGDGTAKRTEKAPGHLDPRAEGFDRAVERALAAGDPASLLALDPVLAADLWVGGLTVWRFAAGATAGVDWQARVHYAAAPYGVGYVVASWRRGSAMTGRGDDRLAFPVGHDQRALVRCRDQVRRFVAKRPLSDERVAAVTLVASELVTNALLHGAAPVTLTVAWAGDVVRLEVSDGGESLPHRRDYDLTASTGRGLALVASLALRWGVTPAGSAGKTVWADVASTGAAGADRASPAAVGTDGREPDWSWSGAPPGSPGVKARLRVPVEDFLALQQHNDAMLREAELVFLAQQFRLPADAPVPPALLRLLREATLPLRHPSQDLRLAAERARHAGEQHFWWEMTVDRSAVAAMRRHVALMEQVDEHARHGELLLEPAGDAVAGLRRTFVRELANVLE